MARYRKRGLVVEAHQWWKNGDHPKDKSVVQSGAGGEDFLTEGKVVRRFRHPQQAGHEVCPVCANRYHDHGWLDQPENDATVCPGMWVVWDGTSYTPYSPKEFDLLYELDYPRTGEVQSGH